MMMMMMVMMMVMLVVMMMMSQVRIVFAKPEWQCVEGVPFHPKCKDISQNIDTCYFSGVWTEQNLELGSRASFANRAQAASSPPLTQG